MLINKSNVTVENMTIIYVDELKLGRGYTVSRMTGFNDLFKLEKKRFNTTVGTNVTSFAWEQVISGTNSIEGTHIIEILQKRWVAVENPKLKMGAML